jgi:hypothetical protein
MKPIKPTHSFTVESKKIFHFALSHVLLKNVKVGPEIMILAQCVLQPTGRPVVSCLPEEKHYNGLNKHNKKEQQAGAELCQAQSQLRQPTEASD